MRGLRIESYRGLAYSLKVKSSCKYAHAPTFAGITQAIRKKDNSRLKFTIETDPAYGKYHWTAHRNCGVSLSRARIWETYNKLTGRFGSEYSVLLDASRDSLNGVVGPDLPDAIIRVRENRLKVIRGYDGVYGRIELPTSNTNKSDEQTVSNTGFEQFM